MISQKSSHLLAVDALFSDRLVQDLELDPADEMYRRNQMAALKREKKTQRIRELRNANEYKSTSSLASQIYDSTNFLNIDDSMTSLPLQKNTLKKNIGAQILSLFTQK